MPWTPRIAMPSHYKKTANKSMHTINKEDPQYNETLLRPVTFSEDQ